MAEKAPVEDGSSPNFNDETSLLDSLKLDSLAIDDTKKVHESLDDVDASTIQAVTAGDTLYASAKRFEDLNLSEELLRGLYAEMKFLRPSKIQAVSLPMILTPPYKHLIAQAHNGSGKTTCFVLGMLSRVDPKLAAPQALCICPTRELAIQFLPSNDCQLQHIRAVLFCHRQPTTTWEWFSSAKGRPTTA